MTATIRVDARRDPLAAPWRWPSSSSPRWPAAPAEPRAAPSRRARPSISTPRAPHSWTPPAGIARASSRCSRCATPRWSARPPRPSVAARLAAQGLIAAVEADGGRADARDGARRRRGHPRGDSRGRHAGGRGRGRARAGRACRRRRRAPRARAGRVIRYDGAAGWSLALVPTLDRFFVERFHRPLPVSALGQTRPTIAWASTTATRSTSPCIPDTAEGRRAHAVSEEPRHSISGVPGRAGRCRTGAHVHIGEPSARFPASECADHAAGSGQGPGGGMTMGAIDWTGLGDETVELLRQYLAIDTTNPPGNEVAGTRFLAEALGRQSIDSQTVESAPGRANLDRAPARRRLAGRHRAAPPHRRRLRRSPLLDGGSLRRRDQGRLPLRARRAGHEVHRHPAAGRACWPSSARGFRSSAISSTSRTADEEAGSALSAPSGTWPTERRDWLAGAEYAHVRAGWHRAARRRIARRFGSIVISEKTGLPLEADGAQRAGPRLDAVADTAPHRLVRALGRLLAAERPLRVLPEVAEFFAADGAACCRATRPAATTTSRPSLRDPAFRARFLADRYRAAHRAHDVRRQHAAGQREAQRDPAGGGGRHRLPDAGRRRSRRRSVRGCAA